MGSISIRPSKGMFNDEEVGTEAHDRIVNWLSLPDNFALVAREVFGLNDGSWLDSSPQIERAITSGRNNFLLGFADVTAPGVLVEVKTGVIRTGELLRQINAYRSALAFQHVWLVTPQGLDDTTVSVLINQGVSYVHFTWGEDGQPRIQADRARQVNLEAHFAEVRRGVLRILQNRAWDRRDEKDLQPEDVEGLDVTLVDDKYVVALPATTVGKLYQPTWFGDQEGKAGAEATITQKLKSAGLISMSAQLEVYRIECAALPKGFWHETGDRG